MIVLGGWRAGEHFTYEVDDGITACAKLTDNLEIGSKFSVVCDGCLFGRLVRERKLLDSLLVTTDRVEKVMKLCKINYTPAARNARLSAIVFVTRGRHRRLQCVVKDVLCDVVPFELLPGVSALEA